MLSLFFHFGHCNEVLSFVLSFSFSLRIGECKAQRLGPPFDVPILATSSIFKSQHQALSHSMQLQTKDLQLKYSIDLVKHVANFSRVAWDQRKTVGTCFHFAPNGVESFALCFNHSGQMILSRNNAESWSLTYLTSLSTLVLPDGDPMIAGYDCLGAKHER